MRLAIVITALLLSFSSIMASKFPFPSAASQQPVIVPWDVEGATTCSTVWVIDKRHDGYAKERPKFATLKSGTKIKIVHEGVHFYHPSDQAECEVMRDLLIESELEENPIIN